MKRARGSVRLADDFMTTEEFVQMRWEEGLSYREIAERYGVGEHEVYYWAWRNVPREQRVRGTASEKARRLRWEEGFEGSCEELAIQVGCTRQTVASAVRTGPRRWRKGKRMGRKRSQCRRCTIFEDERNPINEDGLCSWCQAEAQGWNLLDWHESGAAAAVVLSNCRSQG